MFEKEKKLKEVGNVNLALLCQVNEYQLTNTYIECFCDNRFNQKNIVYKKLSKLI